MCRCILTIIQPIKWHVLKSETPKRNHQNETTVTTETIEAKRPIERNYQSDRNKRTMYYIHYSLLRCFVSRFVDFVVLFRSFRYFVLVVTVVFDGFVLVFRGLVHALPTHYTTVYFASNVRLKFKQNTTALRKRTIY